MNVQCPKCNSTIPADDPLRQAAAPAKVDVPLPARFTLERAGADISIRWKWMTPAVWIQVGVAIPWFGLLCLMLSELFAGSSPLMATILMSPFLALGITGSYSLTCMLVNRTSVGVSGGQLTVSHRPLLWPGNRVMPKSDIQQLYCREKFHDKHRRTVTYQVLLTRRDGTTIKLLGGLEELDQALFIEQELERALGITDRSIRGELKR